MSMGDVNTVVIVGRLTRDLNTAESREYAVTQSGMYRANISVAVNTRRKNGDQWMDEANYFDVTIWGKQAETLAPYLKKGKQIAVEGSLKQDRWVDNTSGQNRSKVYIVANNVHLLGASGRSEGDFQSPMGNAPAAQQAPAANRQPMFQPQAPQFGQQPTGYSGSMDSYSDDLPF